MTNEKKDKIIDRVIEFLHNKPLKSDMRIAAELIEELKLLKKCTTPNVVGRSEQFYCTCSIAKGIDHDEDGMPYCIEYQKPVQ